MSDHKAAGGAISSLLGGILRSSRYELEQKQRPLDQGRAETAAAILALAQEPGCSASTADIGAAPVRERR